MTFLTLIKSLNLRPKNLYEVFYYHNDKTFATDFTTAAASRDSFFFSPLFTKLMYNSALKAQQKVREREEEEDSKIQILIYTRFKILGGWVKR